MAVKASATITLTSYRDTQSVTRYYKLQPAGSSAPLKPDTKPPSSDWTDSEPACDISKELYFCDLTIFSNGEWEYSTVSKSTSYEAAKQAYNKAQGAKDSIDNLEIGGRNYFSNKTDSAFNEANEFTLANYQNTGSFTQFKNLTVPMSYFVGKRCILSFDCISPNGSTSISVYNNNGNPRYRINTSGIISPINNEWVHQELIITVTDLGDSSSYNEAQSNKIEIYCPAQMGCKVRNVKLEIGNRATDWTPAPEDVDAGIANAAKVATNYLHYDSTDGLVLGNKESGSWVGYRTQIDNDSFNVLDENGNIIASYGSNEVDLGKGNPSAINNLRDGKAYVKKYIVGSQNTSVFCGQEVTVVGEWEGASEAYALFKQGFINIGQASSHIKIFNEHGNMNQVEIQGQNIIMLSASTIGNFDCYMKPRFFTMAGEIKMWAGDAIPDGWLLCDGSEVSKTDYPKLYKAIGDL